MWQQIEASVLESAGELAVAVRRAAAGLGGEFPDALAPYVEKVRKYAYRVTDLDVSALREGDYDDDQLFELTVATALGAGLARRRAGLDAIEGAKDR
jgi:alkylhydroperoxidase family enzyme